MEYFSYDISSHPIDILEESVCDLFDQNMRLTVDSISGFERVARKAVTDIRRKDHLKRGCESEAEFKYKWKIECRKKEEKKRAMKEGTWKSQLNRVSYDSDSVDQTKQPISIKKGRFLVTIFTNTEKKNTSKPVQVKRGRFLVTKYLVCNKKEQEKKPTIIKKGRFLITTH